MKIKIGITGQQGFLGTHLHNHIKLYPDLFEIISFDRFVFANEDALNTFVSSCDVIVHLAAVNRDNDPNVIYKTNIDLVERLIKSLEKTNSKPHVFFSSSSQEVKGNVYGNSKKDGRQKLIEWANRNSGKFTGLVIPNVFGPFGKPYYNSFIATFSHQLTHNEFPKIENDSEVELIYVGDLVKIIINSILTATENELFIVPHSDRCKVSFVLSRLEEYKSQYMKLGIIPKFESQFEINLFNTFRSYINISDYFPVKFKKHSDHRGTFVEIIRLNTGGQVSCSSTLSGVTRGNHFHTRKIERFAVIKGKALIQLRRIGTSDVFNFYLDGNDPSYVDMPIWYTHNIINIGNEELYTNFWINEFYDENDPDTFMEVV
jgi:UDP-2-acetamido-2,6-beta-L-arabino-hexul-4-ose reductase